MADKSKNNSSPDDSDMTIEIKIGPDIMWKHDAPVNADSVKTDEKNTESEVDKKPPPEKSSKVSTKISSEIASKISAQKKDSSEQPASTQAKSAEAETSKSEQAAPIQAEVSEVKTAKPEQAVPTQAKASEAKTAITEPATPAQNKLSKAESSTPEQAIAKTNKPETSVSKSGKQKASESESVTKKSLPTQGLFKKNKKIVEEVPETVPVVPVLEKEPSRSLSKAEKKAKKRAEKRARKRERSKTVTPIKRGNSPPPIAETGADSDKTVVQTGGTAAAVGDIDSIFDQNKSPQLGAVPDDGTSVDSSLHKQEDKMIAVRADDVSQATLEGLNLSIGIAPTTEFSLDEQALDKSIRETMGDSPELETIKSKKASAKSKEKVAKIEKKERKRAQKEEKKEAKKKPIKQPAKIQPPAAVPAVNDNVKPVIKSGRISQIEFTASGIEYFKIWIVNALLSVLTLGIYSAWAKVKNRQYLYANTRFLSTQFRFNANPISILKGRLIAAFVIGIAYLAFMLNINVGYAVSIIIVATLPWVITFVYAFNARNTSLHDIYFNFKSPGYFQALMVYLVWPILAVISVGILAPTYVFKRRQFEVEHYTYGANKFLFNARKAEFGRIFIILFSMIIGMVIVFFVLLLAVQTLVSELKGMVIIYSLCCLIILKAVYATEIQNLVWNSIAIKKNHFKSRINVSVTLGFYVLLVLLVLPVTLGVLWAWPTSLLILSSLLCLSWPFILIQMHKYKFKHLAMDISGNIDELISNKQTDGARKSDDLLGHEIGL